MKITVTKRHAFVELQVSDLENTIENTFYRSDIDEINQTIEQLQSLIDDLTELKESTDQNT